jgi:hypothetical protein
MYLESKGEEKFTIIPKADISKPRESYGRAAGMIKRLVSSEMKSRYIYY